jgi:hypothetical protein
VPELHPSLPGVFCAGHAGDGGVVSTNAQRVVLGPSAGNAHWYRGSEIACQHYILNPADPLHPIVTPHVVAVDVFTGALTELWADGANKIVAGSGRWFAVTQTSGIRLDGAVVDYNVRAFAGPYMAWFPWDGTGLILRDAGGHDVTLSTTLGPEEPIQLFDDGGVIWAEGGAVHSYAIPDFPTSPVVVPGGFGWLKAVRIAGTWWLAYQSYALAAVVVHPAIERVGYRYPAPTAFFLDAALLAGRPRVVWSTGAAEAPGEIVVTDVDLSQPRVALDVPPAPIPQPPAITVRSYDPLLKAGEPWHLEFHATETRFLVTKDAKDRLWLEANNAGGHDQTGTVRQLTVEGPTPEPEPMPTLGRFWLQPNIGSTDLIELFDRDNPVTMLAGVDVFSLYVQQILTDVATPQLGPNTYPALVAGDVFQQLKARAIPLAIEMGSIKPGDCQAKQAIAGMQTTLQRVHDAGGTVAAFSMDEPLTANKASCHQSLDACADAVATFTHAVQALGPIAVGWLEAWPEVPVADMETFLHLLQARDALPDYWTLDIDWARASRERQDPVAFLTRCQVLATYYGVTLGIFCNATADPILTDAQHYANVTALGKREQAMVPTIARVCVAAWAHRRANDPTHATQNVPENLGPVGMLTTFAEVRATFEQQPIPAPVPEPEGDPMFATLIDPTKETLAVKAVKPTGDPGVCTLVLADYTTVENGKPVLHVDDVFSCQPDGSAGTRPSGTAGAYERCTVSGNVATFRPVDKYFARHFVKVVGL